MTSAPLRKAAAPARSPDAPDVAALQAMAASAARAITDAPPRFEDRRGPFRPELLVSSRARNSGRIAVRFFSAADALAMVALALVTAASAVSGPLLAAPVASVLPVAVATGVALWAIQGYGLYGFGRNERLATHLGKIGLVFATAGACGYGVDLATGGGPHSLIGLTIWLALAFMTVHMLHVWWWATVRSWRRNGRLTPNVIIVGATRHAERLIKAAMQRRDVNVIGVFDDRLSRNPSSVAGVPVLGDTKALLQHRILPYVDRVVVALDPAAKTRVRELTERLRVLPNELNLLVDLDTESDREAALKRLGDAPLARLSGVPEDERRAFAKRAQDLIVGSLMLAGLMPVMLVIAALVKLTSPGPVFFRQVREGFNNEKIVVWKFRTMRHQPAADPAVVRQVVAGDDRVTPIGAFLRKTSLDELPQLVNVLKGEMSLVGPRPHAPGTMTGDEAAAALVKEYAWRHRIKPGMTGWAAIQGSRGPMDNAADVRRRVALDIEYIERQSFWFDMWIMAVTVPCLLGDKVAVR